LHGDDEQICFDRSHKIRCCESRVSTDAARFNWHFGCTSRQDKFLQGSFLILEGLELSTIFRALLAGGAQLLECRKNSNDI